MKSENLLKELIKDAIVPGELKEKLCSSFDDSDVIAGMFFPFDFECQGNRHCVIQKCWLCSYRRYGKVILGSFLAVSQVTILAHSYSGCFYNFKS